MAVRYNFCFRPELRREECSGFLHLWVRSNPEIVAFIPTSYEVSYGEWDSVGGRILIPEGTGERQLQLAHYAECMARDMETMATVIADLKRKGRCTVAEVVYAVQDSIGGSEIHQPVPVELEVV